MDLGLNHGLMESPAPKPASERIESLDLVRGFALLGILVPNIVAFGWPVAAMTAPSYMNEMLGERSWNTIGHDITSIFFLGKMMALFSMLFGAGVVIYARKFDGADGSGPLSRGAGLWYRRMSWLLLIGVLHGALLWFGDILVWYAVTGLGLVWWMRRLNPRLLIGLGVVAHLFSSLLMLGLSFFGIWAVQQGHISSDEMMGNPVVEINGYTGSYLDSLGVRVPMVLMFWFIYGPLFFPGVTGLMMIGMGLMRTGVLSGERSTRFYAIMAALGLVGGFAVTVSVYFGLTAASEEYGGFLWQSMSQFLGIPISLGYLAVLVLLLRFGVMRWVTGLLANVGRMALSNYLLQTVLCTSFFYGYGGGYFLRVTYPGLFAVIGGVWLVNIVFSAVWLRFFRFGPAEWAWRCLTYWRVFPIRRGGVPAS